MLNSSLECLVNCLAADFNILCNIRKADITLHVLVVLRMGYADLFGGHTELLIARSIAMKALDGNLGDAEHHQLMDLGNGGVQIHEGVFTGAVLARCHHHEAKLR